MSVANIINASKNITPSYIPTIQNVGQLATGPGLPVLTTVNITLPQTGFYILQTYIRKQGAGGADATTSSVFFVTASGGLGECRYTPAMMPSFASEPGVPCSMSGAFYAEAGATTLVFSPGATLNLGASGNAEATVFFLGNSQSN